MTNIQKGQIRVGQSGPIVVGQQSPSTQPPQIRVGQSGPIVVGQQPPNIQKGQIRVEQSGPQTHINNINIDDIKNFVTEGYRKILLREPDPNGLQHYVGSISSGGMTKGIFLGALTSSEEYRSRFGSWTIIDKGIKLIESNRLSDRPWFFGLQGTWWWGLAEEDVRRKLEEFEKGPKIAIASIVRNEEHNGNLGRFLDCCRELEHYHNNIIYIFVEGDSSDRTYDALKTWVDTRDGSILEKMNRGTPHYPKIRDPVRTTILGELRNRLIELILSMPNIAEILMIDANYGWKGDIIASLREIGADITAPLVVSHKDNNGRYVFYDIWAFRKNGREFGPFYPYTEGIESNMPVCVDSVGGGYLVRRNVLDAGVRYSGGDCEHTNFCHHARSMGFSVKINPKIYIIKGGHKE